MLLPSSALSKCREPLPPPLPSTCTLDGPRSAVPAQEMDGRVRCLKTALDSVSFGISTSKSRLAATDAGFSSALSRFRGLSEGITSYALGHAEYAKAKFHYETAQSVALAATGDSSCLEARRAFVQAAKDKRDKSHSALTQSLSVFWTIHSDTSRAVSDAKASLVDAEAAVASAAHPDADAVYSTEINRLRAKIGQMIDESATQQGRMHGLADEGKQLNEMTLAVSRRVLPSIPSVTAPHCAHALAEEILRLRKQLDNKSDAMAAMALQLKSLKEKMSENEALPPPRWAALIPFADTTAATPVKRDFMLSEIFLP